jgi:hypothetical protein
MSGKAQNYSIARGTRCALPGLTWIIPQWVAAEKIAAGAWRRARSQAASAAQELGAEAWSLWYPHRSRRCTSRCMRRCQFAREQDFALPALALLPALARGEDAPGCREALRLVEQLADERASLLEAYRGIRVEARALAAVAQAEGKSEYLGVVEDLVMYARLAEEVLYPAALLAAAFIRSQGGSRPT